MEGRILAQLLIAATIGIVLTGCAAIAPLAPALTGAAPSTGLEVHSQTSIKLDQGNFITLRTNVVGMSKGFKLLGFITFRPATLNEAMNQLYVDAQAQHNRPQTLANLIVERSGIYVILFSIPKVTARADLIEFLPAPRTETTPK